MFISWKKFYQMHNRIYVLEVENESLKRTLDAAEEAIQRISQRLDLITKEESCEEATEKN